MARITIPLFALLAVLPFYLSPLWFLEFFAFLPLMVRRDFGTHLRFGLIYGSLLYAPLIKAIALVTGSVALTAVAYGVFVLSYALYQFGLPWLLNRLGVFYPLAFTLVEVLRLFFPFNGFPYEYLGKVLVNAPLLGLSLHYLTVFGGTFAILTFNWLLYKIVEQWEERPYRYLTLAGGLLIVLATLAGFYKSRLNIPHLGLKIAVVQPFFEQSDKIGNPAFVELYTAYLTTAVPRNVDLVFLPETSIPAEGGLYNFVKAFSEYNLLFGAEEVRYDFERLNLVAENLVVLAERGEIRGIYAKEILVPFGEYTPKGFNWLERFIPYVGNIDYVPGKNVSPFRFGGITILPKVCNEVYYPMGDLKGVDLVAVFSNDAWFGLNFAERHLWEVRLRAIETGKVFVFVNNNGYSGIVYPDGRYFGLPFARVQLLSP